MICAGIDAGSRAIKIVLLESADRKVLAGGITDQGVRQDKLALDLFDQLLHQADVGRSDVKRIIATGYGRNIISIADACITEITCHAVGVRSLLPQAATIIDIGGQDSKLLRLDARGRVYDFAMNDRCAAGTGRFLEIVAERVDAKLGELGTLAAQSRHPAVISSMCVVFAETEIVGLMAGGTAVADIVAGVQRAIAKRITSMAGGDVESPVVFTGGVALIPAMDKALEEALDKKIITCPQPQLTAARGAAILAAQQSEDGDSVI